MDCLHLARGAGLPPEPNAWQLQKALLRFLSEHWRDPDEGVWEVRGPRRHFTHSKIMAGVGDDRAVKDAERYTLDGPVEDWKRTRDQIHAQVCSQGLDAQRHCFVQYYGDNHLDASLLLIPQVGFLPASDPRVRATIDAVQRELTHGGLVQRYATETGVDNLPAGEGTFLACSFWLADALALSGRYDEAEALFERLLGLCNDVGLLAEEYEPRLRCMLGNFPQALSHMALIHTARLLSLPREHVERACAEGERPTAAA
jgi:GH15 family glucan-1,4-alpha-glucosidase